MVDDRSAFRTMIRLATLCYEQGLQDLLDPLGKKIHAILDSNQDRSPSVVNDMVCDELERFEQSLPKKVLQ